MFKVSPIGALVSIVLMGITIEAVESQSKKAAYIMVVLLLLGIITFNAATFAGQFNALMQAFNVKKTYKRTR